MPAITADQIRAENKWTDKDISDTNLGYLIDNVINYVNLMAGTSISNISGGTVTVTSSQDVVLKAGIALMVRAYKDKGPNVVVQGMSVAPIVSDPHYRLMSMIFKQGINMLRGRDFERV